MNDTTFDVKFDMLYVASNPTDTTDHSELTNRELPNQHPIGSITGLTEKLTEIEKQLNFDDEIIIDTTLTKQGQAADAKAVGDALKNLGGGLTSTEKTLILELFRNAAYTSADMGNTLTQLETLWNGSGDDTGGGDTHSHSYTSSVTTAATCTTAGVRTHTCSCGDSYTTEIPATGHNYVDGVCTVCGAADPTYNPDVTLTSISATYSGGDVAVGTAVNSLTGVVVTAHYSNGTSETITGYTLSGAIAEGSNTITVHYGGKTTTFTVTGVAEDSGEQVGVSNETEWTDGVPYTFDWVANEYVGNVANTGKFLPYNGWARSPHLYCYGAAKLIIHNPFAASTYYNAFYDENHNYLSSFTAAKNISDTAFNTITVPEDAVYFAVSYNANETSSTGLPYTITPYESA